MGMNDPNLIIIIPARKGSQRIPYKNRMIINGKTLVERALLCGQEIANILSYNYKLILTTDDQLFLENINDFENLIKIKRPSILSNSNSRMVDVVLHTLKNYGNNNTLVLLLQPSTPFREPKSISHSIKTTLKNNKDKPLSIVATRICSEKPAHIYKSFGNKLLPLQPDLCGKSLNSQEMDNYFVLTGGLYVFWRKFFLKTKKIIDGEIFNYEVNGKYALDLDTNDDLDQLKNYLL